MVESAAHLGVGRAQEHSHRMSVQTSGSEDKRVLFHHTSLAEPCKLYIQISLWVYLPSASFWAFPHPPTRIAGTYPW